MPKIGIIGGSGLDNPDILQNAKDEEIDTPYGRTTSPVKTGTIEGHEVCIVARHGREHTDTPTHVKNRANIATLKDLGCDAIIATTAVGSLRTAIDRGHLVILDQFIDFTRHRVNTFHDTFAPGRPMHAAMADPFDAELRLRMIEACRTLDLTHHEGGTVITIEGPRFSTRAESHMFRGFGADVINMSTAPECALANEAGIPYAAVAMSTDYDVWKEDEEPVTWEAVLEIFSENVTKVTSLLIETIKNMPK